LIGKVYLFRDFPILTMSPTWTHSSYSEDSIVVRVHGKGWRIYDLKSLKEGRKRYFIVGDEDADACQYTHGVLLRQVLLESYSTSVKFSYRGRSYAEDLPESETDTFYLFEKHAVVVSGEDDKTVLLYELNIDLIDLEEDRKDVNNAIRALRGTEFESGIGILNDMLMNLETEYYQKHR
jgi:hypothetical protein